MDEYRPRRLFAPIGAHGVSVSIDARTAPSGDAWEHLGLATAVAIAVDGLLPEEMGFLERLLVGVSVSSMVLLLGQAVVTGQRNLEITRSILTELEAFRAFQVTKAIAEAETGGGLVPDEGDDEG